jgi:hypothetical protein
LLLALAQRPEQPGRRDCGCLCSQVSGQLSESLSYRGLRGISTKPAAAA